MGRNLKLENLTKQFGNLTAVDHVNLEVEEGEFLCFLGPSGCGKTTVLRMITGFETVTEGKILFDGKVINDLIPQKREFGIVFQSYALFPNMSVEEFASAGRMPKALEAYGSDAWTSVSDWRTPYPPSSVEANSNSCLGRALPQLGPF
jgi:ABC-type Fe3+/spermidine/putrescine transport system ATPase subunit